MSRSCWAAAATLALLPLLWLAPCTFGERYFVPYDVNQFPPVATTATDADLKLARAGANFDVTEVPVWFLPELEMARDELTSGRLPTWNPRARTGAPLHAHGLIGLCYPPNWIALFADDPASKLGVIAWINLALGGLLAFGLLRHLGIRVAGAFVGAALFELSGPMATNSMFWMRLASYVWLPGVLWAMARVADADRPRPLDVIGLGVAFAMTWLAGFPPFAATTTVFAGLWFAWLIACRWRATDRAQATRAAVSVGLGLALGACLSLPQVLPSLLFFPESARPPTPAWSDIAGQAFEPYGLLTWLAPDAFGVPTGGDQAPYDRGAVQMLLNTRSTPSGGPATPNYNYTEYSLTISSLGILLALLGAVSARHHRAWFARTALALGLGLGLFAPGLQLLFHLPVFENVWPMRWPAASALFVAWLAALGFERVRDAAPRVAVGAGAGAVIVAAVLWWSSMQPASWHAADADWLSGVLMQRFDQGRDAVVDYLQAGAPPDADRVAQAFSQLRSAGAAGASWLAAAGALLLAFGLTRGRLRVAALSVAVAAAIAQLGLHGAACNQGARAARSEETEVHAFLRERAAALAARGGVTVVRATASPRTPSPGQFAIEGLRDLNFYSHADARTLQPLQRLFERYHGALELDADAGERAAGKGYLTQTLPAALLRHPWFDLVGLRYVLTDEGGLGAPPYSLGDAVGPRLKGRGVFFVHERDTALPRAFVAPRIEVLEDDDAVLTALTEETLAPAAQAYVVRSDLPATVGPTADASDANAQPRAVTFVRDDPAQIELDVAAGSGRALVLSDAFLPGWSVSIDGEPAEALRCNHSQRLVIVPTRACRVVWTYRAPGLDLGLAIAVAGAAAAIAVTLLMRRRRRRPLVTP